mgnify:CR=1 FL=1
MFANEARYLSRPWPAAKADRLYRPPCWAPDAPPDRALAFPADFVPNPSRSWEQAQRYTHADLPGLDDQELWRERERATLAAAWAAPGPVREWAERRLRAIAAEQTRRKRASHGH